MTSVRALVRVVAITAVLGICAMLVPAIASAATTGFSGKVTNAETGKPIEGASVCVYTESGVKRKCTGPITNASGEYKVEEEQGEYRVEFNATGFAAQSTFVLVKANEVTPGIDAALEEAGEGTVAGRVTNASNGQGAGGVEACISAFESSRCAETNGNGEYTISGVAVGFFTIRFSPAQACEEEQGEKIRCQPKSNYIGQSTAVKVKASKTTTVNVSLQAGGQISGTVTNASITHPGLARVEVCATKVTGTTHEIEEFGPGGCAFTNSSGQYTISGLESSGAYKVEFNGVICTVPKKEQRECLEVYVTQYSHGKQTHRQAETVNVTAGSNTSGVNESLHEAFPTTPAGTAAPALTGTPAVGQTLTCSQGSWSHEPTYLVYQWLRNGSAISGQTGSTYAVQAGDPGHTIACSVTAGNGAGATSATSNTVAIPVPLAVVVSIKVRGGVASVTLSCPGVAPCSGVMKITTTKHGKAKQTIGDANFSVAAGKRVTLHVHLTGAGRKALNRSGKHGLKVQIVGSGVKSHTAVVHPASKKKGH